MEVQVLYRFAVAVGLGLLIGIQRENAYEQKNRIEPQAGLYAGARTFPLLSIVGWMAALAAEQLNSPLGFLSLMLPLLTLVAIAYFATARYGEVGMTSEVSGVVAAALGALCYWDYVLLAAAITVSVMLLLTFKLELHTFSQRLTQSDMVAALKFAVISAIILPVLPSTAFGPAPFDVLNARKIWLMVVFISGISFLGYVLIKFVGARRGIGLSGLLGGLVSSTAVTLTVAQRSRTQTALSNAYALAIIVAWTVMFGRVMVEVAVVNLPLLSSVWLPMVAASVVGLLYGYLIYRRADDAEVEGVSVSNPFELTPAIQFAVLYAVILLMANTAQQYFGSTGIYLSSILSGLADVDAITLSMADLSREGGSVAPVTATRAIVLAAMSNTVVKSGIVLTTGSRQIRRILAPGVVLILVTAGATALLVS